MNTTFMEPQLIDPARASIEALKPHWNWDRAIPAPGHMGVDFEGRVDFRRLHNYRLNRAREALKNSECGALLLFDVNNIRYVSSTKIGEWERDKLCRFALLAGDNEPIVWDFGSAAVHHKLYCDWLVADNCKAGMLGMRGTVPPSVGLMKNHAEEVMALLREAGVADMPVGVDIAETAMFFELQKAGMKVVDGQQVMLDAREIKNIDELVLLNQAAAMVDGAYHLIHEELKPGVRENDIVAKVNEFLYRNGSDDVEAINAISGERCSPHPHNFTDRMFRPGDQAFFDILQSFNGYRTCYYRTFNIGRATPSQTDAYIRCREWLDKAIELIRPGQSTDKVAAVWPKAEEFGFPDELTAFGLQFGHGLGLALHERPIISRLVSFEDPMEIKTGMCFALETYCPASDGVSAARIEEEIVVTDTGCKVISLFPAEDLPIANRY
ncbi:Xaa-Pro peptidase family protein [Breoghania sp. L-A4]|uniref:M24 family metallopeptidase n=1 Tax=Breoghania sp. L-A4 TaxID=2304600 RepID=UPI000E3600E9|nr:Xaa-Pro peptidase family protein [Breoghania sp. L-A4]AXS40360.1 aminopeptidase P family protein [Breoghania sp. L-A4]